MGLSQTEPHHRSNGPWSFRPDYPFAPRRFALGRFAQILNLCWIWLQITTSTTVTLTTSRNRMLKLERNNDIHVMRRGIT